MRTIFEFFILEKKKQKKNMVYETNIFFLKSYLRGSFFFWSSETGCINENFSFPNQQTNF